jgi:Kef-type K+ transport system membrane component KefB
VPIDFLSLLIVVAIAALAPLVEEIPFRFRVPAVVMELGLGILVGPHVLGLARADGLLAFMGRLGLAFLFFLGGVETDLHRIRGRPLTLATRGWFLSLALAVSICFVFYRAELILSPTLLAAFLTTTAIGAILPILRDGGELDAPIGRFAVAVGALGEFAPIVLLSLILSHHHNRWVEVALILSFALIALLAGLAALRSRHPRFLDLLERKMHSSSQFPVRISILLLTGMMFLAGRFGIDVLLGSYAAGLVIGLMSHGKEGEPLRHKLDAIGLGFLIPIFIVTSGINFDLTGLLGSVTAIRRMFVVLALLLAIRGLPALLYRKELRKPDRFRLALLSATTLPLGLAISEIGVSEGLMRTDTAAGIVGASILSVLLFPAIAGALRPRRLGE